MARIGVIGGSGLDNPDILTNSRDEEVTTPYGEPSSPLKRGTIGGTEVVLLARHGREHTIPPTQVNYRANIAALKAAGCSHILATTAVGSLREEIQRGHIVIIDQFIDFTNQRKMTFHEVFAPQRPIHTPMGDPYDADLRKLFIAECGRLGYTHHDKGTVVTIEGPRFSTRAESRMFRVLGADIINMSVATETVLAREAEIPYAAVAVSTDYDSWREDEEPVTWEAIAKVFADNAQRVTTLLAAVIPQVYSWLALKKTPILRQPVLRQYSGPGGWRRSPRRRPLPSRRPVPWTSGLPRTTLPGAGPTRPCSRPRGSSPKRPPRPWTRNWRK
jgi:5'-methylthioadenosine phosphorylase